VLVGGGGGRKQAGKEEEGEGRQSGKNSIPVCQQVIAYF